MHTPFLESLMKFHQRVLEQGYTDPNQTHTIQELKELLFFNQVFHSNCEEMFTKYTMPDSLIEEYIRLHRIYIQNVATISQHLMDACPGVVLGSNNSFERRWNTMELVGKRMQVYYHDLRWGMRFSFEPDQIYYIAQKDQHLIITTIDPHAPTYDTPVSCTFKDHITYWKTDTSIMNYMMDRFDVTEVVAIRVTLFKEEPNPIRKVEYNGCKPLMERILDLFGYKALILSSPALYVDDIKQMIQNHLPNTQKKKSIPAKKYVDLRKFLEHDMILEYPTDSFMSYLEFLSQAASAPNVIAIYITLYRIGDSPALFYILRRAARNAIQVHVNIELCASNESINQDWKRELERSGVHVTAYATGTWKVHSKLTLLVFDDGRMVSQIGTGNYHTETTSQYTDLSLITGDPELCKQVLSLFGLFQGLSVPEFDRRMLVTQFNCREVLYELIDQEIEKGSNGYLSFKCNALDDEEINKRLSKAARAGCKMDFVIRGVCTWIPPELGENVTIRSFVWDKLEHSRVYSFGRSNPSIYLGSLDLVTKKIDERIETLVRVMDPELVIQVSAYLNRYLTNPDGWYLMPDGSYRREAPHAIGLRPQQNHLVESSD